MVPFVCFRWLRTILKLGILPNSNPESCQIHHEILVVIEGEGSPGGIYKETPLLPKTSTLWGILPSRKPKAISSRFLPSKDKLFPIRIV